MKFNIKSYIKNSFIKGTVVTKNNLVSAAAIGSIGHPLFTILHLYVFNMVWDNLVLKFSGALICLLLLTKKHWPNKIISLFPAYWHFMLIYNLPFLITLTALKNYFVETWFLWELIMIFILIMYVPNWLVFSFDLVIGILAAWTCYSLSTPSYFVLDFNLALYGCTFAFAIIAGFIFSYSNYKGIAANERAKILQSLSGSITHEMRNPLTTLQLSALAVKDILEKSYVKAAAGENKNPDQIILNKKDLEEALEYLEISDLTAKHGNMIIDMILEQIYDKPINKNKFQPFSVLVTIKETLRQYAFNKGEKEKVIINIDKNDDFVYKGNEILLIFTLFNLIKNALYYCKTHPDSVITISVKKENGQNLLYFKDTGPGIPSDKLPSIFESFKTSGKKGGTGLGLPFCKRIMESFDGSIECSSEFGKWTEFVMRFPKCDLAPVKEYQEKLSTITNVKIANDSAKTTNKNNQNFNPDKKTIIVTDDEIVTRKFTRKKLELFGFNVIECESVTKVIPILENPEMRIDLIFMDIQMPDFNGIEATKMIRSGEHFTNYQDYKTVPIISLSAYSADQIANDSQGSGISDHLEKNANTEQLVGVLNKWLKMDLKML